MSREKVTFYGHFSGWSSYPSVCKSIAQWLSQQGVDLELCDLRPEQAFDGVQNIPQASQSVHRGVAQRAQQQTLGFVPQPPTRPGVSLLFGFPVWSGAIPRHEKAVGYHVGDVDRIPRLWVDYMNKEDVILTPSSWSQSAFQASGVIRPVHVVQHGISSILRARHYPKRREIVHFCSAREPSRKGTLKLIQAIEQIRPLMLEKGLVLRIYSNSSAVRLAVSSSHTDKVLELQQDSPGAPDLMAEKLARSLMVIQPSRGEGFGLCPLEALGAGTPIVATRCTGHTEYLTENTPGSVIVPTGRLEPCGGGKAPALDANDIASALTNAIERIDSLSQEAYRGIDAIHEQWSWDAVLRRSALLKSLGST